MSQGGSLIWHTMEDDPWTLGLPASTSHFWHYGYVSPHQVYVASKTEYRNLSALGKFSTNWTISIS